MTAANGRETRSWPSLARHQPRPIGGQVQTHVRQTEMLAQAAATIRMRTTTRTRADNGARLSPGERSVAGCVEGRRLDDLVTRVANAAAIIRESAGVGAAI